MRNAILLLLQFSYHLLFLALQFISFYIIINYNKEQKSIFINSTNLFSRSINTKVDKFNNYVRLREENDSLQSQNAKLIKKFIDSDINLSIVKDDTLTVDSTKFKIQGVQICNSTFHLIDNHITLCQGTKQGIAKDMGVVSQNGLVGIVKKTSENFSIVMSILHSQTSISCGIKRNKSTGTLVWKSGYPKIMNLESIPKHLNVVQGDTVITSGYSTIFPKGIMVGRVKTVTLEAGNNTFTIEVELFNDPAAWDAVYVIRNEFGEEQRLLEASISREGQ